MFIHPRGHGDFFGPQRTRRRHKGHKDLLYCGQFYEVFASCSTDCALIHPLCPLCFPLAGFVSFVVHQLNGDTCRSQATWKGLNLPFNK
jgi:hypothetical protein